MSLKQKIVSTFLGTVLLFGLSVATVVYVLTARALRTQVDQRASALAINLSDVVAGFMSVRNFLELHALATKYARLDGVAYVFIEDRNGEVVAQTLGTFPQFLRQAVTSDQRRQPDHRIVTLHNRRVYETRMPVLEGQVGAVHVGIWQDIVQEEIYRAIFPIMGLIGLLLLVSLVLSLMLVRAVTRPILRLAATADKISKGDLETAVGIDSHDEIGELALSLERMRASLKAAMVRLKRHPVPG